MPPKDIPSRVSALEGEVVHLRSEVREAGADAKAARLLASGADRDVSSVREELRAHTRVINALREDHVEFTAEMYLFRDETRRNFEQVSANFVGINANFAHVDEEFGEVHRRIDDLRAEMRESIGGLRTEMRESIDGAVGGLRTEMRESIDGAVGGLRAEMRESVDELRQGIAQVIELVRPRPEE